MRYFYERQQPKKAPFWPLSPNFAPYFGSAQVTPWPGPFLCWTYVHNHCQILLYLFYFCACLTLFVTGLKICLKYKIKDNKNKIRKLDSEFRFGWRILVCYLLWKKRVREKVTRWPAKMVLFKIPSSSTFK